jgi:hypothetical protein
MTAKIDGTNGILQQYDYQVSTTGFSYTFAAGTTVLVMNPAGTLATGTITMPAAPADGMTITFSSTQTITALTVNANTGQSIVSAATTLPARQAGGYIYRLSNTTWYPFESVPTNVPTVPAGGSIITSGTAVASTSGTSVTVSTSIPSWVKRVTVVFQGVSTNGTSNLLVQIGSGSVQTTGYISTGTSIDQANGTGGGNATNGFLLRFGLAAQIGSGHMLLTLISGNTWVSSHTLKTATNLLSVGGGDVTLAGALDRLILTTVNGTDVFDAGSINILYE